MESVQPQTRIGPELWVDEYGDYLFRYAYSRLRDSNLAEEVVQETFLAGIRNHAQFKATGSERGWLLAILKRKIIDSVRKRARHEVVVSTEEQNDPSEIMFDANGNWRAQALKWDWLPERNMESSELLQIVQGCLSNLPSSQADVFVLSVMEEMSTPEICKSLEITPSNYWVRLHRARLGLAKCVGAKWFDQEKEHNHAK